MIFLSVLIFGTTLVIMAAVLFQAIRSTQQTAFDSALYNYAVEIAGGIDINFLGDLVVKRGGLVDTNKIFPFPLGKSIVHIRTLDGDILMTNHRFALPLAEETQRSLPSATAIFRSAQLRSHDYRIVHYVIRRPTIPPLLLQVAVPMTVLENQRNQLLPWLWLLIPVTLVAAAIVGLITSTRALAPVYRIIDSARGIRPDELSARVPVPEETELKELALTLNGLLARLQQAFKSQENFIADASHQLKTPLAIMRGELDVFLSADRKPEESKQLLESFSQEINQLSKLVDDMLLLARFDSGTRLSPPSRVRLDEILLEAMTPLDKLAFEKKVQIVCNFTSSTAPLSETQGTEIVENTESAPSEDFEVSGDADLLRILFYNLIENAIKYAPDSGRVSIQLKSEESSIAITVEDNGPGIAQEEVERIFDRFYRGSLSQHRVQGIGLGLAIAHRIANLHGAELDVQSESGRGALFRVRIKKF